MKLPLRMAKKRLGGCGRHRGRGRPPLTWAAESEQAQLLHRRRAARRGARRRGAARDPGLADPPEADARPRPPGRPRGHAAGRSAGEPQISRRTTSTARSTSCATASTSSARPSPRSARRATTRSSSSSRASRIPKPQQRSSARRPNSSSSTSRRTSCAVDLLQGQPVENATLYALLASAVAGRRTSSSDAWYIVNTKTKRVVSGPYGSKAEALQEARRQAAKGHQALRRSREHGRRDLRPGRRVCPAANGAGVPPDRRCTTS